jgi:hypothetical protein
MGLFCILHPPPFLGGVGGPGEFLGGDGFAPDCPLSQPVVVNPAIWWIPQEVPHSRPYSGRNRTGEGAGAVRFALDRLVISARPIPVRFGVGIELAEAE